MVSRKKTMKYLFTSKECPHCKTAKKKFKKQLKSGEIKEVSADTDKGFKLSEKFQMIFFIK